MYELFEEKCEIFSSNLLFFRKKLAKKNFGYFFFISYQQMTIVYCMNIEQRAAAVIDKYGRSKWNCRDCISGILRNNNINTIKKASTSTFTHKVKTKEKPRMMWAVKWVIIFDSPPFIKERKRKRKNQTHMIRSEKRMNDEMKQRRRIRSNRFLYIYGPCDVRTYLIRKLWETKYKRQSMSSTCSVFIA